MTCFDIEPVTASTFALAIHTASPDLGLAVRHLAGEQRSQVWPLGRDTSSQLHHYLAEFLRPQTWADLACVGVAVGPGGFTGTRLGVVTARTLAQQLEIPLFPVSTLAAIAQSQRHTLTQPLDIAVQMPAQRGQLFGAVYHVSPLPQVPQLKLRDAVMTPDRWQQTLEQWPEPYQLITVQGSLGASVVEVLELAVLAWQAGQRPHWSETLPFYGQHPVES